MDPGMFRVGTAEKVVIWAGVIGAFLFVFFLGRLSTYLPTPHITWMNP